MSPDDLLQMFSGHQVTSLVRTGVQLGAFDALDAGPRTAEQVASAIDAHPRGARVLLDALAVLGLVHHEEGHYALTDVSRNHLVANRPAYLGDVCRLFTDDALFDRMRDLPAAVRAGGAVTADHAETPEHPWWERFVEWSPALAAPAAGAAAEALASWAEEQGEISVLDLACGAGLFGAAFAARHEKAQVSYLDWPNVLSKTRASVEGMGVGEHAEYLAGDMFALDLGGPYDLVLASHVFHHFDPARCAVLLRRLAEVMPVGARLLVNDFVSGATPNPFPVLFSATMLVWTRHGEAHSLETYRRLFEETGFSEPVVHSADGGASSLLVAARR